MVQFAKRNTGVPGTSVVVEGSSEDIDTHCAVTSVETKFIITTKTFPNVSFQPRHTEHKHEFNECMPYIFFKT